MGPPWALTPIPVEGGVWEVPLGAHKLGEVEGRHGSQKNEKTVRIGPHKGVWGIS